jgi:threonylcarbamoyladenosine tRNA methylthiotransferase MtaB
VINQFRQLVEAGCPEIVLTGIHIGTYGAGLASKTNLTGLMETLISVRGQTRIRLSSIEPNEITDKMIGFLGRGLCRHLHIPLQSGDDLILQAMNRHYTAGFYRDLIDRIAQEVPGIALGADIMVGFPGEGEKEFRNTVNLVEESSLTHLHVFSYSPRPGTPAAEMKNQVPESVKKARSEELRQIGIKKNLEFRKKQVGTELKIVIEEKRVQGTDTLTGFTDNYIRAAVMGANKEHVGKELTIKIEDVTEKENFAITL